MRRGNASEWEQVFLRGMMRAEKESWQTNPNYYLDNGFPSAAVMAQYHTPIVEIIQQLGLSREARVLDLGCGNGALLARLSLDRPDLVPCGVERDSERLSFVRTLFPEGKGEWYAGDLLNCAEPWVGGRRYAAALLMVGRLTEAKENEVHMLRQRLRGQVEHIVGYAYPDWLLRYESFAALCAAAAAAPIGKLAATDFVAVIRL
jgi:trans-aconitate methyltransferase